MERVASSVKIVGFISPQKTNLSRKKTKKFGLKNGLLENRPMSRFLLNRVIL